MIKFHSLITHTHGASTCNYCVMLRHQSYYYYYVIFSALFSRIHERINNFTNSLFLSSIIIIIILIIIMIVNITMKLVCYGNIATTRVTLTSVKHQFNITLLPSNTSWDVHFFP